MHHFPLGSNKFYIIPLNESEGIKELRVSSFPYSFMGNGPVSGVIVNGKPIEEYIFDSADEATDFINEHAGWLAA